MDIYQIWTTYNKQWSRYEISAFVGVLILVCMGWILDTAQDQLGAKTFSYYGWWKEKQKNSTLYELKYGVLISGILSRITGLHGIWNIFGTYALIKKYLQILFIYIIFICGIQMSLWWILSAEGYEAAIGKLCGCAAEHDVCHCRIQPHTKGFYR